MNQEFTHQRVRGVIANPAIVQAVTDWAATLRQPVYVLKNVKAQKTRHPRWSELVNVVRKAKFNAADSEITAAIDAVIQAEAADAAANPPVLVLEV